MLQAHYMYCALYFYYYYISSNSDHQALDPGAWGPLPYKLHSIFHAQCPGSSMSAGYFAEAEVRSCFPCPFALSQDLLPLELSLSLQEDQQVSSLVGYFFQLLPARGCALGPLWNPHKQLAPRQVKFQKAGLQSSPTGPRSTDNPIRGGATEGPHLTPSWQPPWQALPCLVDLFNAQQCLVRT